MSDINEILADVKVEGADPELGTVEKDTPAESLPENKPEADKPKEGENTPEKELPFHEHPRWKQREEELNNLRATVEDNAKVIAELNDFKSKSSNKSESAIPGWFVELYGENQVAWEKYSEHDKGVREEIKREVLQAQAEERQRSEQELKHWDKWVSDEISKLANDPEIKFDTTKRNDLIKVMLEYRPTDENNNFDFKAGHKIWQALQVKEVSPEKSQARKRLGDITTKSSSSETTKDLLTSNDLRGKSWNQL